MFKNILLRLGRRKHIVSSSEIINSSFFTDRNLIEKINFKYVVRRVMNHNKQGLIPDPLAFKDINWLVNNADKDFNKYIFLYYKPGYKEVYDMPKGNFLYRPIVYLQPIDSVVYQALVDRLINYKRTKFSHQVYSNIINDINSAEVFHNPVMHWLDMRENIRNQYSKGYNYYFFSDISGYFENIKIQKLIKNFKFYIGRNDVGYLGYLNTLLTLWQYADAQGLAQPHDASSILSKAYLSVVDSRLGYLGKNYSRYVDEFHILAKSKPELLKITQQLSEGLRELGLNLNVAKVKLFEGEDIAKELDKNRDFFDGVAYLRNAKKAYTEAFEKITAKEKELEENYTKNKELDPKIFRYCLHASQRNGWPGMVEFCLRIIDQFPEQTIDIVKYFNIFINDGSDKRISECIIEFLRDKNVNLYNWQQVWLFALLFEINDRNDLDFDLIWNVANDENQDVLSRGICFLILTKHFDDNELIFLLDHYKKTKSITLKRILLFCISKLPNTLTQGLYDEVVDEQLGIKITKKFLQNNAINFSTHKIIE